MQLLPEESIYRYDRVENLIKGDFISWLLLLSSQNPRLCQSCYHRDQSWSMVRALTVRQHLTKEKNKQKNDTFNSHLSLQKSVGFDWRRRSKRVLDVVWLLQQWPTHMIVLWRCEALWDSTRRQQRFIKRSLHFLFPTITRALLCRWMYL